MDDEDITKIDKVMVITVHSNKIYKRNISLDFLVKKVEHYSFKNMDL